MVAFHYARPTGQRPPGLDQPKAMALTFFYSFPKFPSYVKSSDENLGN